MAKKGINIRNIILIIVIVLIVLFVLYMAYSPKRTKEVVGEDELATLVPGDDGRVYSTANDCNSNDDCKICVQTCINKKCVYNGMISCPNGNCVSQDIGATPCECDPPCKLCTEVCTQYGRCVPSGDELCTNGYCERIGFCDIRQNCDPPCDETCEDCLFSNGEYQCFSLVDDLLTGRTHKRCNGVCVRNDDYCPQDCNPQCKSCVEECINIGNNKLVCRTSIKKVCPDGSCRKSTFDCSVLPQPTTTA